MHGITPISSTNPSYPTFCNEVFLHYVSNVSSAKWDVNFIGQTKRFLDHKKGSKTKILNQDGEDALSYNLFIEKSEVLSKDENKFLKWFSGQTRSQSTYSKETNPDYRALLQSAKIPTIDRFYRLKNIPVINSTPDGAISVETIEDRLLDELRSVYKDAKHYYQDLDDAKFELGFKEAVDLINSQIFDEKLYPDISIESYGEFIFSHDSNAGYVDIGVRGERRVSYHVMNDVLPEETRYDNHKWDEDYTIPMDLYSALKSLKQYL